MISKQALDNLDGATRLVLSFYKKDAEDFKKRLCEAELREAQMREELVRLWEENRILRKELDR